ncbi:hypothetical protein [Intrasporangium sp. YIM S08009]|uniref:hypothetical protein n=1 Tax=Intrasporangium zincisolvens TaxID=3080018 RepID=UPI002B05BFDF|nr:hypothetical protein [Intrasporangium sp. YIM S08009]
MAGNDGDLEDATRGAAEQLQRTATRARALGVSLPTFEEPADVLVQPRLPFPKDARPDVQQGLT